MNRRRFWIKSKVVELFADRGLALCKSADSGQVKRFLEQLHPVITDKPLIRVGEPGDGSYLIPDAIEGVVACFSPGVGHSASFEAALLQRGIPCYLADASVPGPPISHPLLHFRKKFLGLVDDETTLTLENWVNCCAPGKGDLLLQMDIEGAEWPVLLNAPDAVLGRFRIVAMELHEMGRLLDPFAFRMISATFQRILRLFHVVHLHPNNHLPPKVGSGLALPRNVDITLLRRDFGQAAGFVSKFPHPLDTPTVPTEPDYPLPREWYRTSN